MKRKAKTSFVVCTDTGEYQVSLISRRIYTRVSDPEAESKGLMRIIDESQEDYLYPETLFTPIALPAPVARKLRRAA